MAKITNHQGNANQTTMMYDFSSVKMTHQKKIDLERWFSV